MKGHCILSHGLDSSPRATKVSAMAAAAEALGWTAERPDYSDIDSGGRIADVSLRLQRLLQQCHQAQRPLLLAGSSMGAFISALATLEVRCVGLFLLAPPVQMDGFPRRLSAAVQPTVVVHGWHDELIPAGDVIRWAQRRHDRLIMVDDNHRLEKHVQYVADEFGRFVASLT
jgi:alpha/beta superfamily hydrolase